MDSLTINLRNKRDKLVDELHNYQTEIEECEIKLETLNTNLSKYLVINLG